MLDKVESWLKIFPPPTRERLRSLWLTLPPDVRGDFQTTLKALDSLMRDDPRALSQLLTLMTNNLAPLTEPLTDVAVLGPVNVGKSSLYNALVPDPQQRAVVAPVPGTTKDVQAGEVGLFRVMDTPGAGHWADEDKTEINKALAAARAAHFHLIVFDASRGVLTSDRELYKSLAALGKPHLVALNKIDLISPRHRQAVIGSAASALGLQPEQVIAVSATSGVGIHGLILEIAVAEPRLLGYLGTVLPAMRRSLAWMVVRRSAITSTLVALAPLPFIDLLPLTLVQMSMILNISRIYAQPMTLKTAAELLGGFGIGLLARSLFYELVKLGGIPGWVIAASVAGSTTVAIGYAAIRWCEKGERFSRDDMRRVLRMVQRGLLQRLRRLGRRRPDKKALTAELEEGLPAVTDELERTL